MVQGILLNSLKTAIGQGTINPHKSLAIAIVRNFYALTLTGPETKIYSAVNVKL
jgi:hypothetical protein